MRVDWRGRGELAQHRAGGGHADQKGWVSSCVDGRWAQSSRVDPRRRGSSRPIANGGKGACVSTLEGGGGRRRGGEVVERSCVHCAIAKND